MKTFILAILLCLFVVCPTFAANTLTTSSDTWQLKEVTMSFDGTGRLCYQSAHFLYHSFIGKATGTISYDYETSINDSPAAGEFDILQSAMTGSDSAKISMVSPFMCINVTVCTGCTLSAKAWSVPAWR